MRTQDPITLVTANNHEELRDAAKRKPAEFHIDQRTECIDAFSFLLFYAGISAASHPFFSGRGHFYPLQYPLAVDLHDRPDVRVRHGGEHFNVELTVSTPRAQIYALANKHRFPNQCTMGVAIPEEHGAFDKNKVLAEMSFSFGHRWKRADEQLGRWVNGIIAVVREKASKAIGYERSAPLLLWLQDRFTLFGPDQHRVGQSILMEQAHWSLNAGLASLGWSVFDLIFIEETQHVAVFAKNGYYHWLASDIRSIYP